MRRAQGRQRSARANDSGSTCSFIPFILEHTTAFFFVHLHVFLFVFSFSICPLQRFFNFFRKLANHSDRNNYHFDFIHFFLALSFAPALCFSPFVVDSVLFDYIFTLASIFFPWASIERERK